MSSSQSGNRLRAFSIKVSRDSFFETTMFTPAACTVLRGSVSPNMVNIMMGVFCRILLQLRRGFQAIHYGHGKIQDDQFRLPLSGFLYCVGSRGYRPPPEPCESDSGGARL